MHKYIRIASPHFLILDAVSSTLSRLFGGRVAGTMIVPKSATYKASVNSFLFQRPDHYLEFRK